jgi:uncharacterized protein
MANRLAAETSPYLLQHAHNPVDWYPWGEEALARARELQRPIFLSVGYAACHWCHVMERESFENEQTAALLNDHFVAIKVDREERPDIDAIYMDAVQQMTGQGGWPMSVFLNPDGKPFYAGTYFPDTPRHGLPSFRQVLDGVARAWAKQRPELDAAGGRTAAAVAAAVRAPLGPSPAASPDYIESALASLENSFDSRHGGWGHAPKFPQPATIEFLLRYHLSTGNDRALAMARRTLDAMAAGGMFDQLGGGFARYSTDATWLVPHFEKMLYDNALLARVYVHAWQVTRDARYRAVAEQTLHFAERELKTPEGGFAASLDADTAGVEGGTYLWNKAQIDELLGADAAAFEDAYGVTENGNWEGSNILHLASGDGPPPELEEARAILLADRQGRPQPARDDKVLTSWNGLMIGALADAAVAFGDSHWAHVAARAADLLLTRVRDRDGRLRRSFKDGRALHAGVLEDYAHLADGLLALYQATFEERWFVAARDLAVQMLDHFADPAGGFFDTADDHEALFARPRGLQDSPVPSGNASAVEVLLRLAALSGEERFRTAAEGALAVVGATPARYPTAFAQWLSDGLLSRRGLAEVAITGEPGAADTLALLDVIHAAYRPFCVVALGGAGAVALLTDRPRLAERATAYVCRDFACRQPVTRPTDLAAQL